MRAPLRRAELKSRPPPVLPSIMFITDSDGIVLYNYRWQSRLASAADESVGGHFLSLIHPADWASMLDAWRVAAVTRERHETKFRFLGERCDYRLLAFRVAPVLRSGRPPHWIFSPIPLDGPKSEAAQRFDELQAQFAEQKRYVSIVEAALARSQRLEALGNLTSSVAHDFNNFITVIGGSLSLIEEISTDPKIRRLAHHGNRAVTRSTDLVKKLLDRSGQRPSVPPRLNVLLLCEEIAPILQRALPKNVAFSIQADADLYAEQLDPVEFESALLNLTINAHHAMPNGGSLSIRARSCPAEEPGRPGELADVETFVIEVTDTGCGIAPEILDRVIERYFTTKAAHGTGIGLAMVDGFARGAGGALRIASELGKGTRVLLYLRRVADVTLGS